MVSNLIWLDTLFFKLILTLIWLNTAYDVLLVALFCRRSEEELDFNINYNFTDNFKEFYCFFRKIKFIKKTAKTFVGPSYTASVSPDSLIFCHCLNE